MPDITEDLPPPVSPSVQLFQSRVDAAANSAREQMLGRIVMQLITAAGGEGQATVLLEELQRVEGERDALRTEVQQLRPRPEPAA